ncbi:hypothetical protein BJY04DRAFT_184448 [Aspergillus karnatakaensis]|uniref:uncharacterized protein n=1 Tax=Aspergillus karnatakaensis TaxID=1810916 RepID=UPI003CCCD757
MPGQRIQKPDMEDPEEVAAQANRYKHALLLLVETIRKNHPEDTHNLIDAIRGTSSVPEAAELLIRLSESQSQNTTVNRSGSGNGDGSSTQS